MLTKEETKRLKLSLVVPVLFVFILWIVWLFNYAERLDLYQLGIYPREVSGLYGIIFAPLIHANIDHLFANSLPLVILGSCINYFYRTLAFKVVAITWIFGGVSVWIGARDNYHIGASGLIYGLASFLFFSGIIRRDVRLAAISLLVVFLYGSMIWGIFPLSPGISWESHFFGGLCGLITAILYRKEGPQRKEVDWGDDDESDVEFYDFEEKEKELDKRDN